MKVAINRCWGGFGISSMALLELVKMNSDLIEKHSEWRFTDYDLSHEKYIGEGLYSCNEWELHTKDRNTIYTSNAEDDENRSHPDLISVIELLGIEQASGNLGAIEIREIPDGIDFYIDNYDGMESIHETHKSW